MINLNTNRDKSWSVIDWLYNDEVYIGSYDDCCEFIKKQGSDDFLYEIVSRTKYGM